MYLCLVIDVCITMLCTSNVLLDSRTAKVEHCSNCHPADSQNYQVSSQPILKNTVVGFMHGICAGWLRAAVELNSLIQGYLTTTVGRLNSVMLCYICLSDFYNQPT